MDVGLGEAAPPQADHVEADQVRERALRHAPGDDVGPDAAQPDDHRALADAHELAHRRLSAEEAVVADARMAAEHGIVGHDHVVADLAVMGHMRSRHQKAMVADLGDAAIVFRAGIDGDVLADVAIRADGEPRRPAAVFDRLRRRAQRGERIDHGARPDRGMPGDVHMGDEPAAFADDDVGSDDAIGSDRRVGSDLRARARCGRSGRSRSSQPHAVAIMAPTSASATITPATLASPRYHHMVLRLAILVM